MQVLMNSYVSGEAGWKARLTSFYSYSGIYSVKVLP